jgi:hypothetical protein
MPMVINSDIQHIHAEYDADNHLHQDVFWEIH